MPNLLGTNFPIIQAPMAGVQDSRLTAAVSNAGGLGSLPCAMLTADALKAELEILKVSTDQPFNLNFFAHTPPKPDDTQEQAWRLAQVLSRWARPLCCARRPPPGRFIVRR